MLSSLRHVIVGSLAGAIVIASAVHAAATDKPNVTTSEVSSDLKRLGAQLDLYAEEANRTKLATALTGLGVGSALVPSGIVLLGRTDGISRALVIGMVVGGSAQIASVPLVLIPTRMDEIHHEFMNRPENLDNESTVRTFEEKWRLAAEASRRRRAYVGTTLLIVGTVNLATGLTLLLAPAGILGMSRKTQYTLGGVVLGIGVPVTTISVRFLLEWSLEETSWEAYRTMAFDVGYMGRPRLPSFGVVPMPGGALGFATISF